MKKTIALVCLVLAGCDSNDEFNNLPDCRSIATVVMAKYDLPYNDRNNQVVQDACQKGRGMYHSRHTWEYDEYREYVDTAKKYATGTNKKVISITDDAITAGYYLQVRLMKKAP